MMQENQGVWKYEKLLPFIPPDDRLTLSEGSTQTVRADNTYFKCEFENPSGSVKDRGLAYQVSSLQEKKIKRAVIPSSGNAALSATKYCKLANISLTVYVSNKINPSKLHLLQQSGADIVKTKRPVSLSVKAARKIGVANLRQSTDPLGHIGYQTISFELHDEYPAIDAVFLPVSSGTTLIGVAEGFEKVGLFPSIHAVQTEAVHPVAKYYDKEFRQTISSVADALVARFVPKLMQIRKYIDKSDGWGWVVSDTEIKKAREKLLQWEIDCSYEGAACFAGLLKAKSRGYKFRHPVCLLTGKFYDK